MWQYNHPIKIAIKAIKDLLGERFRRCLGIAAFGQGFDTPRSTTYIKKSSAYAGLFFIARIIPIMALYIARVKCYNIYANKP
jgi:hypothetical protein